MWKPIIFVVIQIQIFLPLLIFKTEANSYMKQFTETETCRQGNRLHYGSGKCKHQLSEKKIKVKVTGNGRVNKTGDLFTEVLCRKETDKSVNNESLHCYHLFDLHTHLRLFRFKVEQLHLDPAVVMFHEIVNDEETEVLKRLAKPQLESGTVNFGIKWYNYRVSQVAWLQDRAHEVVSRVSGRVALVTGLSVRRAERLQLANYGIGGFYAPHFDSRHAPDKMKKVRSGDRAATVLFYLSDVELGGATVFLRLGLTVFPKKHSAVFWRNLLPSGDVDERALHAACPVLRGDKWTATKWISL